MQLLSCISPIAGQQYCESNAGIALIDSFNRRTEWTFIKSSKQRHLNSKWKHECGVH